MPNQASSTIIIHSPKSTRNIFPHILILIGGLLLFFESWATKVGGFSALVAGIFALFIRSGMELDTHAHLYRNFLRLGTWRWGKWQPLAEINYVAIVRVRLTQLAFRPSEATFRQSEDKLEVAYNVNLILKDSPKKVMKLYTGNLVQAMEITKDVAKKLNLHIYDCSTSNKKWIDPETGNTIDA